MTCAKHLETPVTIYSQCVGCELEALRARVAELKEERDRYRITLSNLLDEADANGPSPSVFLEPK